MQNFILSTDYVNIEISPVDYIRSPDCSVGQIHSNNESSHKNTRSQQISTPSGTTSSNTIKTQGSSK